MPKFFGKNRNKINKEKSLQAVEPKRISIERCESTGALSDSADPSPPTRLRYNKHTGVTVRRSPKNEDEQSRNISAGHDDHQGNKVRQPIGILSANVDGLSPETNELVDADNQESNSLAVRFDFEHHQGFSDKDRHTNNSRKSSGESDHGEDFPSVGKDEKIVGRRAGKVQEVQPLEFQLEANRLTKSISRSIRRFSKKAKAESCNTDVCASVSERSQLREEHFHDNVHIEREKGQSGSPKINQKARLEEEKTRRSVQDQELQELPKGVPENLEIIEGNEQTEKKLNKSDKEGGRLEFQVLAEKFSKRKEKLKASLRGTKKKPMNNYECEEDEQKGKFKSPRPPPASPKPPEAKHSERKQTPTSRRILARKLRKGRNSADEERISLWSSRKVCGYDKLFGL